MHDCRAIRARHSSAHPAYRLPQVEGACFPVARLVCYFLCASHTLFSKNQPHTTLFSYEHKTSCITVDRVAHYTPTSVVEQLFSREDWPPHFHRDCLADQSSQESQTGDSMLGDIQLPKQSFGYQRYLASLLSLFSALH